MQVGFRDPALYSVETTQSTSAGSIAGDDIYKTNGDTLADMQSSLEREPRSEAGLRRSVGLATGIH